MNGLIKIIDMLGLTIANLEQQIQQLQAELRAAQELQPAAKKPQMFGAHYFGQPYFGQGYASTNVVSATFLKTRDLIATIITRTPSVFIRTR